MQHDSLLRLGVLSVVQGYHELYELHRSRLDTQLLHTMKERDCWIQLSLSLAEKVLNGFFNSVDFLCWFLTVAGFMPNKKVTVF